MYKEFVSYIREIYKTPTGFLPLHEPRFIGNEEKYVLDAIKSTFVSSVGEYVNRFEEMMCQITGAKHVVAMVNGTNALHLGLELIGVKQGDEVLTQPLTFVSTANAISYCKATPHFIDVDKDTMGLSPMKLKAHLQEIAEIKNGHCYNRNTGRRIAACVPMHTFGLALYIEELKTVCDEYNIPIVEDAAESLGTYANDKHTGTFGEIGIFSFNGNKTVTCGGGGALVTNNDALAKKAKHLSTQAKVPHKWEYTHDEIGYNYRMPNLNAALACAQLEMLPQFIENKRKTHHMYASYLKNNTALQLAEEIENTKSNYWLNAILLESKEKREEFLTFTNENGIMTRPIWKLMNHLDLFKDCPKGNLVNAEYLEERIVNITSSVRING
jgi:aminotransferase in exopolysaccharide biosynthesis